MCSHPDHEIVERADGIVEETHVWVTADIQRLTDAVSRMAVAVDYAARGFQLLTLVADGD
jgi:hypothetical protein